MHTTLPKAPKMRTPSEGVSIVGTRHTASILEKVKTPIVFVCNLFNPLFCLQVKGVHVVWTNSMVMGCNHSRTVRGWPFLLEETPS